MKPHVVFGEHDRQGSLRPGKRGLWQHAGVSSREPAYLVGLHLTGRRVVVVGGGHVVARRLRTLLTSGARVHVVSPRLEPAVEAAARAGEITWEPREYRDGDLADAWYAMAATDSPAVNAAVVAEAETHRVFCVRADDALGGSVAGSLGTVLLGTVVIGVATLGGLVFARVPELQGPLAAVRTRLGRG